MMKENSAAADEYSDYRKKYIEKTWADLEKRLAMANKMRFPFYIVSLQCVCYAFKI
jgi:hypothetical protein